MELHLLADRLDLRPQVEPLGNLWPEFMLWDPIGDLYFGDLAAWAQHIVVAVDDGRVVARAMSVPFTLGENEELPDGGWDEAIIRATVARAQGREPNAVTALEITIVPDLRGTGMSHTMLSAMRENVARLGFDVLYAPVRPNHKSHEPSTPMSEYAFRVRDDGLPYDPWLRVHARAGGEIVKVAPFSMVIPGTLAQWRARTGLPFDRSGPATVEGALVDVHVDVDQDHAVYVEPNVWVRHDL